MAMRIEQHRAEIVKVSQRLSCSIETILMLLKIKARLADDHYQKLRHFLSPIIDDLNETGWEEITFAGLKHLIATSLSGS